MARSVRFPLDIGRLTACEPKILYFHGPAALRICKGYFHRLDPVFLKSENAIVMRAQTLSEARRILAIFMLLAIRAVPPDPNLVVAPADGIVRDIVELDENEVLKTKTRRIGIFLSVFDVHTNRAPIDGRIIYRQHREGLCLDARRPDCSEKNESMTWAFENSRVTIVVRQLTGAIARRIVAWADVGDELKKGERFGMIRFGSRTEVYLPLSATVVVKAGEHVAGGSTIIARLPD